MSTYCVDSEEKLEAAVALLNANDPRLESIDISSFDINELTFRLQTIVAHVDHRHSYLQRITIRAFREPSDSLNSEIALLLHKDIPCQEMLIWSRSNGLCQAIASPLLSNSYLKTLQLHHCHIGDDSGKILAQVLSHPQCTLEELILQRNEIGDSTCSTIMDALPHNSSLKMLDLFWNRIGAEGCRAIATALQNKAQVSLERLKLTNNHHIGNDGCISIAKALRQNTSLKILHLANCGISNEGWDSMEWTLRKKNFTLHELSIDGYAAFSTYKKTFKCLLAFNKEKPVEAKATKTGVFHAQLLTTPSKQQQQLEEEDEQKGISASCFVEMFAKVISYGSLSVLFSFTTECPSFFNAYPLVPIDQHVETAKDLRVHYLD